jgi:SAM-dependent methyltransferase
MPSTEQPYNADKAGKAHWDQTERNAGLLIERFAPTPGLRGFARRRWHAMFQRALGREGTGRRLLELGCGGSAFLPYFAQEFGFSVSGIDYSEGGCIQARELCAAQGVAADIVCADFFAAPPSLHGVFDAVVSFGVVEHFGDTAATVGHFARFLRPGGVLLTMVPNMHGAVGASQRWLNRSVYDKHEQIDPERLRAAHASAGLQVVECDYFLFCNFGVVNIGSEAGAARRQAFLALRAATGIVWAGETLAGSPRPRRGLSPYVLCVAKRHKE